MKRTALIALIIILNLPGILLAQTLQMLLPGGNGAWLVQVVTSGGILGKGDLDFAVSSEGKMSCSFQVRCPTDFKAADFHPMGIVQIYTTSWDEATRDQVPQEVTRVYDAFRALVK